MALGNFFARYVVLKSLITVTAQFLTRDLKATPEPNSVHSKYPEVCRD
jgi:hypothetical protein